MRINVKILHFPWALVEVKQFTAFFVAEQIRDFVSADQTCQVIETHFAGKSGSCGQEHGPFLVDSGLADDLLHVFLPLGQSVAPSGADLIHFVLERA